MIQEVLTLSASVHSTAILTSPAAQNMYALTVKAQAYAVSVTVTAAVRSILQTVSVSSYLLSANPNWFGNKGRNVVITGGSIVKGAEEIKDATNSFGDALKLVTFDDADTYAKHIITSRGDYVYRAEKADDASALCIFIPLECEVRDIQQK